MVRIVLLGLAIVASAACGSSASAPPRAAPDGAGASIDDAAATADATSEATAGEFAEASLADSGDAPALDDVLVPPDAQRLGDAAGAPRSFTVTNLCTQTVWAAALPASTFPGGVVEMAPGYAFQVGVDNGWSGRIWGKVDCTTSSGKLTCASDPFPSSLAELTLTTTPATGLDFYDVSLVDGFNLPIEIIAEGHTPDAAHPYDCGDPSCAPDLNATCPAPLQDTAGGQVLACANDECKVLGGGDAASPDCIYPNQYTRFFKTACPTAYSYPTDDPTSTFTCKGPNDYAVVFCPSGT